MAPPLALVSKGSTGSGCNWSLCWSAIAEATAASAKEVASAIPALLLEVSWRESRISTEDGKGGYTMSLFGIFFVIFSSFCLLSVGIQAFLSCPCGRFFLELLHMGLLPHRIFPLMNLE